MPLEAPGADGGPFSISYMYPLIYFRSFNQLGTGDEVFVAMPMSDDFESIWTDVFAEAIMAIGLRPFRVDEPELRGRILLYGQGLVDALSTLSPTSSVSTPSDCFKGVTRFQGPLSASIRTICNSGD